MIAQKKKRLIMRVAWTETLQALNIGDFVEAELVDRINIVRHISRIAKQEKKKFSTKKVEKNRVIVVRVS